MFRNRGIVRDAGSKDGDRYARSSSAEAMVITTVECRLSENYFTL